MSESASLYDPFSPSLRKDPYPVYRELRDHAPASYNAEYDFWVLSRFADVVHGLQSPLVYSSAQGIGVGMTSEMSNLMPSMITMDPPRHNQMRALVNHAFTPRRIGALEPRIREVARGLLDDFSGAGSCDLVADFTAPFPTIVIAELLGIPIEDQKWFKEKSNELINQAGRPRPGPPDPAMLTPVLELMQYLARIYDERRKVPRDDLMSALLEAEVDGQKLTHQELTGFALLLLVAWNETTTNLISNGLMLLHEHPEQRAKLAGDPSGIPSAIEEFLRFESPIPGIARTLTEDVELHGEKLVKGQKTMLLFASANRDERRIEDPDRFDVTRKPGQHLGFGFGTHFCLGASLARLESRIAFEELLARIPDYALLPGAERNQSGIRGFARLPSASPPA